MAAAPATAAISIAGPSSAWTPIPGNYDYLGDHQTGQPAGDIVGSGSDSGFFVTFDNNGAASSSDGTLGFRLRLDAAGGNSANPQFDRVVWVGIDGNGNGSVDLFLGYSAQGSTRTLGIFAPGTGTNTSPSTTSIAASPTNSYSITSTNFNYRPVNFATDGGTTNDLTPGGIDRDYYLSFSVPFADIAAALGLGANDIPDQRPLRYVLATSTQMNSLNQDLGGIQGGVNSNSTWESLGGFTPLMNASGTVIPEPSAAVLSWLSLLALAGIRRRI